MMVATAVAAAVTWVSAAAASTAALVATSMSVYAGVSIGTAMAITSAMGSLAISSLGSFAINAVFAPKVNSAGSPIAFKADPSSPIRGIMGRFGTGGTQNHMRVWGKDNLMISFSVILSLGPIQGIEKFTANDQLVTFPGANGLAANVEPYKNKMWMTYKNGLPTDGALGPPPTGGSPTMTEWTVNHRTSGYAGAFWTMQNNSKRASFEGGVPIPNWTVLGMKLYDPRKDSTQVTIGGSGAHRLNDWRTWEYSNNPYIHSINWCLGHHKKLSAGIVDRNKLLAGVGATIDRIDLPTMVAAANVCDINGWTLAGEWSTQDDKWQVLASMMQAGSGIPVHVGAKIGAMINAPRTSVATITNNDIIGKMNLKVMASRRDRFNTIFPRYINEQQGWEYSTAGAVTAAAYREQDSGVERSKELTYNYVDKSLQAGQLAAYDLANTRETLKIGFPAKPHLLGIKPGDAVTVYSVEHGLDNQKFIVMARPIELMEGTIGFELRSETDAKHAWALGQADQPAPSPGLTAFDAAPSPPQEEHWVALPRPPEPGGPSQPGIILDGEVPDGIGGLLVEVGPTNDGPWQQVYDGPPTTESIDVTGLKAETIYYMALTYKSVVAGIPSDKLILGPFTTPSLTANNSLELGGRTADEIFADMDGTQEQLDAALAELDLAIAALDVRTDAVEADINDPTTGLIVRVGQNETATDSVADRVTVVETSINTPGTGLSAKVASLETAVIDLDAGKADATRVTALEATVNTAGTGLSARAASLETATANLQTGKADATRVTALEARAGGSNLLPKSQWFAPDSALSGWLIGGNNAPVCYVNTYLPSGPGNNELSMVALDAGPGAGGCAYFLSPAIPAKSGQRYCGSAYCASSVGQASVYLAAYDSALGYLGECPRIIALAGSFGKLDNWNRVACFYTTPPGTSFVRLLLFSYSPGGGYLEGSYLRPMVSEATPTQTEAPPYSPSASEARLSVQEAASADLYGRTMARWAVGAAVPGAVAFIEARAETSPGATPTSSVAIGARQFAVFNPAGGDWKKALEVVGGNVVLSGGLQAGAFIRLGNGQGWPVALKPVEFSAGDGEVISFGTDLGTLPNLNFVKDNLLPLSAGEVYDIKATGLTSTGFTMYAKIIVPGTPTNFDRTASATTSAFGSGGIYIDKTADANSNDGTYRVVGNGCNHHAFFGLGGGGIGPDDFDYVNDIVEVWVKKAGVWSKAADYVNFSQVDRRSYGTGYNNASGYWSMDETFNFGDGVQQVGIRHANPDSYAYAAGFTHLMWTAPGSSSSTRTALSSGGKTKVRVTPQ